jgi:lysyl-tRNA synthetase class 2
MKRLLAAGSGDIYQICKVFRDGESGRNHNLEFTLLEWYRLDWNADQLQTEIVTLIQSLAETSLTVTRLSYSECFMKILAVNPLNTSRQELRTVARSNNLDPEGELSEDGWLDLLFALIVVPAFPEDRLTIVTDYPASQAALARLNADGETAARFEVFWGQTELANGYHELLDPQEQRQRFEQDQKIRVASGLPVMPLDEYFLAALETGLPDCAGVALGVDRLLMKICGLDHIDKVIPFPVSRA